MSYALIREDDSSTVIRYKAIVQKRKDCTVVTTKEPADIKCFKNIYRANQYSPSARYKVVPYEEAKQLIEEQAKLLALFNLMDN